MTNLELAIELAKLVVAILGAVVVAWYWNRRRHELEGYEYLDRAYNELLQLYFDHPEFGDARNTEKYGTVFQGEKLTQYHFFAMRIHTVMETIFDLSSGRIPKEWANIFTYHTNLHRRWLTENRTLQEHGYVALVLRQSDE